MVGKLSVVDKNSTKNVNPGHRRGWSIWPFGILFPRHKVAKPRKGNEDERNLSGSFSEHTWDIDQTIQNHPNSKIDKKTIAQSGGLDAGTAKRLLEENGPNALPKPKEMSDIELYFRQFLNLLWVLLIFAASLSLIDFFTDISDKTSLWTAIVMYVMIWIMCTSSWWQEREARRVVAGFQNLLPDTCEVLRDGQYTQISAPDLVLGDLIRISSGTRVPADCRVLQVTQLKLETSSITGEAEPIEYHIEPVAENVSVFESHNIAFNGSLCVDGEGIGLVIRTGTDTIIGQIAAMTTSQKNTKSRFELEILHFVRFLAVTSVVLGTIVFVAAGLVRGWTNTIRIITTAYLVCAIGMVPTGLPATVTSILTVTARVMASKNIYLKRLDIVESLGSSNIIASDKTGTLTMNKMTVTNLWFSNQIVTASTETAASMASSIKNAMIRHMCICSSARFAEEKKVDGGLNPKFEGKDDNKAVAVEREVLGSASEAAMIKFADRLTDVEKLRRDATIVFEIPFNSVRKWQLKIEKICELKDGEAEYKLYITGASDILLNMCDEIETDEGHKPYDIEQQTYFQDAYDRFGSEGRRVIGFAQLVFHAPSDIHFDAEEGNVPMTGFCFLGVVAIMDPPRPATAEAIAICKRAGIKVFMVTGDHPATAQGIARQIGMLSDTEKNWAVVHGEKIPKLTPEEWDSLVLCDYLVFARTTPEQKLMIVEQCQKRKFVITMTGDGVNDSPALKKANVGIAMGSGSDVAKQAADIILMDDNFASIVKGIEQGRLIFDNIKKLIVYLMTHCFPEIWAVVVNFVFGLPLGLTTLQILSIDLGTELAPGIAMYKEPIEGDIMSRPPRTMGKRLVSNSLIFYGYFFMGQIQSAIGFLAYLCVFWHHNIGLGDLWMSAKNCWQAGGDPFTSNGRTFSVEEQLGIQAQACAAWQIGIVFCQFFHIFSTRTRRVSIFSHGLFVNSFANASLFIEIILVIIINYVPGIKTFFGGEPPVWYVWPVVAACGLLVVAYNEIRKWLTRRYPRNPVLCFLKW